jgi:hypothetical protein
MTLLTAEFVAFLAHSRYDYVALSGSLAKRVTLGREFAGQPFVLPVIAGVVLGALLGYLSRRLVRIAARLIFFCSLLPIVAIFVYAFVVRRLAPGVAESLPFAPVACGAIVYGIFLAVAAPTRVR